MIPPPHRARLAVELVLGIALAETAVMFILPVVAPGIGLVTAALLDAAILSALSWAVIEWRGLRAAKRAAATAPSATGTGATDLARVADAAPRASLVSVAVVLIGGLTVTGLGTRYVANEVERNARQDFDMLSERLTREVARRVGQSVYGLMGAKGVYAASGSVTRRQFAAYVASRDLAAEFPGTLGFGFVQRVARPELPAFIAAERADGAPDFAVRARPPSLGGQGSADMVVAEQPDLYVVKHVFPEPRNRAEWGLDLGTEPASRAAAELAVRSGEPTISARVALEPGDGAPVVYRYFVPVYRSGAPSNTPAAREAALVGLVYAPVRLEEALGDITGTVSDKLDVQLFAGEEALAAPLAFSLDSHRGQEPGWTRDVSFAQLQRSLRTSFPLGGRTWTVVTRTTPAFEMAVNHDLPPLIGLGGTSLAMMLAGLFWSVGTSRRRAVDLALYMTADLAAAKLVAEAALRETDALRATLDLHNIVSVTDPAGRIISVNDAFCRISGYTREELIGQDHRICHSGTHPPAFWAEMWTVISGGLAWRGEVCNRAKDGSHYWVDSVIAPFKSLDGAIDRYVSIQTDITGVKAQADALSRASFDTRRLAAAIDGHADAVFLTDPAGTITRVNAAFTTMTGYTAEEAVGQPTSILKSGRTSPAVYLDLWATISAGRAWRGRMSNRRASRAGGTNQRQTRLPVFGQTRRRPEDEAGVYWVSATITPVRDAAGAVEGYLAMQRDITAEVALELAERHRVEGAEARLRVARALGGAGRLTDRLALAIDVTLDMNDLAVHRMGGIFLLEPGDTHLRLASYRGAFSDEFVRDEATIALGQCLCGRAARDGELIVSDDCFTDHRHDNAWPGMTAHGHYIVPLMDSAAFAAGAVASKACLGVLFLYTDPYPSATEERLSALREIGVLLATAILHDRAAWLAEQARTSAEAASRAKSEFLANMSHEIRTPLTAIMGFADVLREEGGLELSAELRAQTVDTITSAGAHLLTVINNILDLSKIEAGRMTVERIDSPLATVLRDVESMIRPKAAGKGVTLSARLANPLPEHILSDPTRLRQILMNLVDNAVKFTSAGRVSITAGSEGSGPEARLMIDIEDTGAGMTPEQVKRLFETFSQGDSTVTRKHGGSGLGLTISRRLATLMGGDVLLVRTTPEVGTCFRLVLPLEPAPYSAMITTLGAIRTPTVSPSGAAKVRLAGRILLAEDGLDNQRLIAFHLERAGAEVTVAANGRIALALLDDAAAAGTPFDLLLTDMQMPEMDGYALARTLRERRSTLPIVALTAHAMAEDRDRCLEAGCDDYTTKPIDKPTLLSICRTWIDSAKRQGS